MCGIYGFIGEGKVEDLVNGLKKLEYRGYDSAGIAFVKSKNLVVEKRTGKVDALRSLMNGRLEEKINAGIAHTRWATHGMPTDVNAHPQMDCTKKIAVVHNGIIENFATLRDRLTSEGHTFVSQTDTEVIAHLTEKYFRGDLFEAVRLATLDLEGTYAIGVIHADIEDEVIFARKKSPLVIAANNYGTYCASDVTPLISVSRDVVFLEDGQIARLKRNKFEIFESSGKPVENHFYHINWDEKSAEKGGYKHFMMKEIHEEPRVISDALMGRIKNEKVFFEEIKDWNEYIKNLRKINVIACGTSFHAGLVFKYFLEKLRPFDVEVEVSSEFRYRNIFIDDKVLNIAISQSGETADTLESVRLVRSLGGRVLAISNVVGSTLTREADRTLYINAGPEISVASTKAYIGQITVLYLFALYMDQLMGGNHPEIVKNLMKLPEIVDNFILTQEDSIKSIADKYVGYTNFMYIGRGINYPSALEGALKLKEISYTNAVGYQAGELKHGPIALLDEKFPVMAIVVDDELKDKMISNVLETKARNSQVVAIVSASDRKVSSLVNDVIRVPDLESYLYPFVVGISLQLFAYNIANDRNLNIDMPRNLAKSVTVE
ncbi:MAG: glutamine--fructose-6-phosphate transaminase (isomerizing) [Mesoaciditoga sp.]|uniref:glutamine--fructose-6-phosphate transaminase (isomerizing) n=1 Tax=Athalassotoga sp. TaxID=2022597 RepID=UPI000CAEFA07|nr:MAG: glutamine--fructose-6-phosphate transaminase (isomerizing) [Mesoaciditoga sp.]PMP80840.1 MAG: glutamine--fructose-6-phosphate transaminase (isomerizing) [Mesoaciditoga sp.]HEU24168.1 glutamine--fructose-6-phosphate transaminase (isomerizing) [Mesoaciditoga lauensis]